MARNVFKNHDGSSFALTLKTETLNSEALPRVRFKIRL